MSTDSGGESNDMVDENDMDNTSFTMTTFKDFIVPLAFSVPLAQFPSQNSLRYIAPPVVGVGLCETERNRQFHKNCTLSTSRPISFH